MSDSSVISRAAGDTPVSHEPGVPSSILKTDVDGCVNADTVQFRALETTQPAIPGTARLYLKDDNQLYLMTSDGSEISVSSGSTVIVGSGGTVLGSVGFIPVFASTMVINNSCVRQFSEVGSYKDYFLQMYNPNAGGASYIQFTTAQTGSGDTTGRAAAVLGLFNRGDAFNGAYGASMTYFPKYDDGYAGGECALQAQDILSGDKKAGTIFLVAGYQAGTGQSGDVWIYPPRAASSTAGPNKIFMQLVADNKFVFGFPIHDASEMEWVSSIPGVVEMKRGPVVLQLANSNNDGWIATPNLAAMFDAGNTGTVGAVDGTLRPHQAHYVGSGGIHIGLGSGSVSQYSAAAIEVGSQKLVVDVSGNLTTASIGNRYDRQTPTTGASHTIANDVSTVVIRPAGTINDYTLVMPSSPTDGMLLRICSSQTITNLSLSGNSGQTVLGAVTTLAANAYAVYQYVAQDTSWYRVG